MRAEVKTCAQVIVITNQKGGVGKSTTAESLAEGLHIKGYKTLLIDLDPQGSATLITGADTTKPTAYDLLTDRVTPDDVIQHRENRADIIPAEKNLERLDIELPASGKDQRLKKKIAPLTTQYDYIILDTPPALGIITINALTAADCVVIPIQADIMSLQGLGQLYNTICEIREYTNPNLKLRGILLTRHNPRTLLSRGMANNAKIMADEIGTFVYDTVIRESISLKESQAARQNIYTYAKSNFSEKNYLSCNAALDYTAFVDEFIKRGQRHE